MIDRADKKATYKKEIVAIIEKIDSEISLKALYSQAIILYKRDAEHRAEQSTNEETDRQCLSRRIKLWKSIKNK